MRTPATAALDALGIAYTAHAFPTGSAGTYGRAAAAALGADPDRVLKTLVLAVGGSTATAIVPVSASLDLRAVAAALGEKHAAMADPALAQRRTGYVVGGISPFGQRSPGRSVVDESALRFDTVFVSGGRRGLDLELAPADLIRAAAATTAAIAR